MDAAIHNWLFAPSPHGPPHRTYLGVGVSMQQDLMRQTVRLATERGAITFTIQALDRMEPEAFHAAMLGLVGGESFIQVVHEPGEDERLLLAPLH